MRTMHLTLGDREYSVTEDGQITRLAYQFVTPTGGKATKKAILLKPSLTRNGYLRVCLSAGHFFIHRIVWTAFNGEVPPEMDIDHINGDKQDNRLENLRIATRTQNALSRKRANSNSASGMRGVYFRNSSKQWCFAVSGNLIASSKERAVVEEIAKKHHG